MSSMPELIQSALSALRHMQPTDRVTAIAILNLWAHVAEIDVERVVDYYFFGGRPGAIEVADGHVVSECCGRVDDAPHKNFCPNWAPWRDGYSTGFVDCLKAQAEQKAEQERPSSSLDESRDRLVASALSALVTVGMLSGESAEVLEILWDRRGRLTAIELTAIRAAVAEPHVRDDQGFAERFLEQQRAKRVAADESLADA